MPLSAKVIAKEAVAAAAEFFERKLWQRYDSSHLLALSVPSQPDPVFAYILGSRRTSYGLGVTFGPRALEGARTIDEREAGFADHVPLLMVSLSTMRELADAYRKPLMEIGWSKAIAPVLVVKDPHRDPRPARRRELETLLYILRGLLRLDAAGLELPRVDLEAGAGRQITLSGDPRRPAFSIDVMSFSVPEALPAEPLALPAAVRVLARQPGTWLVGVVPLPGHVRGESRSLSGLVAVDRQQDRIVGIAVVLGGMLAPGIDQLYDWLLGKSKHWNAGLPAAIDFADRTLHEMLAEGFGAAGVECRLVDSEALAPLASDLERSFWQDREPAQAAARLLGMPLDDDLEGWKEVDRELWSELRDATARRPGKHVRAWYAYFGADVEGARLEEDCITAALDWMAIDFRPPGEPSVAEELREAGLPAAQARLLDAVRSARVAFWRIAAVTPGESIELLDVLGGERVRVHDTAMSMNVEVDWVFFGRVYEAGAFRFLVLAGPAFGAIEAAEVVTHLEELLAERGAELTAEALARESDLCGWFWLWRRERRRAKRRLRDPEGHLLQIMKAEFEVESPEALEEVLDRHPDLELVEDGEWTWSRPADPAGGLRRRIGRLSLLDDWLEVEVLTRAHLDEIRALLEGVDGVQLLSVEQVDPDAPRPLDDRLDLAGPDEHQPAVEDLPEATRAALEAQVRRMELAWLDLEIPALGGQTPRAAWRTAAGRRRVMALIRSRPSPGKGIAGLAAEELLQALGDEPPDRPDTPHELEAEG